MSNAIIPAPGGSTTTEFAFRSGTTIAYINFDVARLDQALRAACAPSSVMNSRRSLGHLVAGHQQRLRNRQAERLRSSQVYDEI
jgi:hypothetical protein